MSTLGTYTPDNLLAGDLPQVREEVTVLSGQNLTRGAVLGKIGVSVPTTGTADGGNTGNGTCTGVAGKKDTKQGVYTLECIAAAADGGTFSVADPDGIRLDDAEVGSAYDNNQIGFTVNDGSTDFAVGDKFTITVAAGSGKYNLCDKAATDGSQKASRILLEDVDASAADAVGIAARTGEFNEDAISLAGGTTKDDVRDDLAAIGIFLKAPSN